MDFWRDEFSVQEIQLLLDKVKGFRVVADDGRVSLHGRGDFDGWTAVLVSASGLQVKTDALRTRIIRDVLFSPDLPEDFSEEDFKKVTYKVRNKLQNEEIYAYKVVFPIWNKPNFLRGIRRNGDVTLNFSASQKTPLFRKIVRERYAQCECLSDKEFFTDARLREIRKCSLCIANVRANNPADANERASEALYEVLGFVNLAKDTGKFSRSSSSRVGGKLPVSDVLIAPQTTTHTATGALTHDGFWYEDWVGGPNKKTINPEVLQGWERRFGKLVEGCTKSHWKDKCKSAAARYYKAFSNPNLEESFLEGWRLFENISGSRSEKIVEQLRRASSIFKENAEYLMIGRHLALRRNLLTHGHAIRSNDYETLAFQMRRFVAPFLEWYVINAYSLSSPEEFWEFLDLPPERLKRLSEREALERKLELLNKAAQFRGEQE